MIAYPRKAKTKKLEPMRRSEIGRSKFGSVNQTAAKCVFGNREVHEAQ
jgi:hypothetical protein